MTPVLANVSFGLYALMPLGWVFMAAIIAIEIVVLSRFLGGVWWHRKALIAAVVANLVSGAVGFGLSLLHNGGWWLVVWMPWVSSHEVDFGRHLAALSIYYAVAFVLSVSIEGVVEQRMFRSQFEMKRIWQGCVLSNLVSYAVGGVGMYSWSFGLWR